MRFKCPFCSHDLNVADSCAGQLLCCPICQKQCRAPTPATVDFMAVPAGQIRGRWQDYGVVPADDSGYQQPIGIPRPAPASATGDGPPSVPTGPVPVVPIGSAVAAGLPSASVALHEKFRPSAVSEAGPITMVYITPWQFVRTAALIAWHSFRHPSTTTTIDMESGQIVQQ